MSKTAKLELDFASGSKNQIKLFSLTVPFCQWNWLHVRYVYKELILLNAQQASAMLFVSQIWKQLQITNQKSLQNRLCHLNFRKLKQVDINRFVPCHLRAHKRQTGPSLWFITYPATTLTPWHLHAPSNLKITSKVAPSSSHILASQQDLNTSWKCSCLHCTNYHIYALSSDWRQHQAYFSHGILTKWQNVL